MGEAIDLSLKAIEATVEPYIGLTCNLVLWIQFFNIPISKRVSKINTLEKLSGHIKNSCFKPKKVCIINS